MLGVVSEQFPKGGALTLNMIAGVGMLGVGIVGSVFLGYIQDTSVYAELGKQRPEIQSQISTEQKSVFGVYHSLDQAKLASLSEGDQKEIATIQNTGKKSALATVAIFPVIMFVCYMILIFYFKSKGGYQAQELVGHAAKDEQYTGGTEGPAGA